MPRVGGRIDSGKSPGILQLRGSGLSARIAPLRTLPDCLIPTTTYCRPHPPMLDILIEYLRFLSRQKKLWLLPLVLVLLALGGVAALGQGSAALPFIYALF